MHGADGLGARACSASWLLAGSTGTHGVRTKYGMYQDDHILFIASGAFTSPNHPT